MDNIITLPSDCSCCILRENILDCMAESGLPLSELLYVLETAKQDAAAMCAANEDDDGSAS
jgi:hypothetical protein